MALFSPNTILRHIREYLPRVTSLFSEQPAVAGTIIAGDPQTLRITELAHGRIAGATIDLLNVVIPNDITAAAEFEDTDGTRGLRFTTNADHDLVADYTEGSTVVLQGFTNSVLNDTFDIYGVPSRTTFEIVTAEAVPTLTGSEELLETWELGPQGFREIDTVVDVDTYDVLLTGLPTFQAGVLESISVVTEWRISVVQDIQRVNEMYTKQAPTVDWLYLIMEEAITSKDWKANSDAVATNTGQSENRLKILNNFSLVSIIPTAGQITAEDAIQAAWTTILTALWSVLYDFTFEGFDLGEYAVAPTGHGSTQYNRAYYGHAYAFQFVYEINGEIGFHVSIPETRAFRDGELNLLEPADGSTVDIDETG